ncbi:uncharacterized protein METZ01_LOCUS433286, partial [marine metagenome]
MAEVPGSIPGAPTIFSRTRSKIGISGRPSRYANL